MMYIQMLTIFTSIKNSKNQSKYLRFFEYELNISLRSFLDLFYADNFISDVCLVTVKWFIMHNCVFFVHVIAILKLENQKLNKIP